MALAPCAVRGIMPRLIGVTDGEGPSCRSDHLTRCGIVIAACFVLLAAGCGRRDASSLAPVCGKVSYQGRPLHTGTIVFAPDPVRGTSGEIGPCGNPGRWHLPAQVRRPAWHRSRLAPCHRDCRRGGPLGPRRPVPHSLLPLKYRDPELSGLSCEVTAGRENTINFNLQ